MPSWTNILIGLITLQIAYTIYTVITRLFLSPLRHIPGPKLAALTSWYEFYYDAIQQGKFVWKIKDLHSKYGLHVLPRHNYEHLMFILCRSHCANYTMGSPC